MFNKKSEPAEPGGVEKGRREPSGVVTDQPAPAAPSKGGGSVIGPSILIQGDMSGDEDLVIQGRIEGSLSLKKNLATIGKDGRLKATVNAQTIRVEGTVEGELHGREQVIVTRTGTVHGNIAAPRVTLEDGCRFKGSIAMEGSDTGSVSKASKAPDIMLGASVANETGKTN